MEQHRKLLGTFEDETFRRHLAAGQLPGTRIASFDLHPPYLQPKHDPEAFYYDWSTIRPVKKGVLICDLWRHQDSGVTFAFEVIFTEEGEARGSIFCSVHAENLTKPATSRVSVVRIIEIFRPLALARKMVENCG